MDAASFMRSDKYENLLALAVGVGTWEAQSTTPFDVGISIFSQQRFADAIAQTFGSNVARLVFPAVNLRSPGQAITPWGALNKYTGSGIVLLVLDKMLTSFGVSEYKQFDGLPGTVRGLGLGLLGGGIVGGFFNPYPTGRPPIGFTAPIGAPISVNAPALSTYTAASSNVNAALSR